MTNRSHFNLSSLTLCLLTLSGPGHAQETEGDPTQPTSPRQEVPSEAEQGEATASNESVAESEPDAQEASAAVPAKDDAKTDTDAAKEPTATPAKDDAKTDAAKGTPAEANAKTGADAAKEANNPLSNLTSLSFQNNKTLELSQDSDETRSQGISNVLNIRFAQSLGKRVIMRASLPLVSTYNEEKSGLGDMNIIVPILLNSDASPLKFGVGPLANLRTHTDGLGADAWGLGLSATAFFMKNPLFQPGALVTWSYNVAAETQSDKGNLITAQPFLFFQLGHGTYIRSSAIAIFDLEHDRHNVPVGLGIGQVVKQGRVIFNIYGEGQQTVWSHGALLPTSQIFFGLNTQLLPRH